MKERFIHPFTDFALKKLWGEDTAIDISNYNHKKLKNYRDLKNSIDTTIEEAVDKKMHEVAKQLKASGVSLDIIIQTTHLTKEEMDNL